MIKTQINIEKEPTVLGLRPTPGSARLRELEILFPCTFRVLFNFSIKKRKKN